MPDCSAGAIMNSIAPNCPAGSLRPGSGVGTGAAKVALVVSAAANAETAVRNFRFGLRLLSMSTPWSIWPTYSLYLRYGFDEDNKW